MKRETSIITPGMVISHRTITKAELAELVKDAIEVKENKLCGYTSYKLPNGDKVVYYTRTNSRFLMEVNHNA